MFDILQQLEQQYMKAESRLKKNGKLLSRAKEDQT